MSNRRTHRIVALVAVALFTPVAAAAAGNSPGEVVDRFFAAYGERSLEGMLASYAADVVFEDVNQRHHSCNMISPAARSRCRQTPPRHPAKGPSPIWS